MSKITLPMPRLGETMEQGTIVAWLVDVGADFNRGDPLLELETDKTLVEYPALGAGVLVETLVSEGDIIEVGSPIAIIESEDAWTGIESNTDELGETKLDTVNETVKTAIEINLGDMSNDRVRATPLARKKARDAQIDISLITGSGRRNRVEAYDVERMLEKADMALPKVTKGQNCEADFLLVHGFAGDSSTWAALASSLKRGGRKVEAVDLPGHGNNETTANDLEDLVSWLVDMLRKTAKPVHLVAHSLGSYIAARAAQIAPDHVTRLTLIAPVGCGSDINGSFISGMSNASSEGELTHLLRLLGPKASTLSKDILKGMAIEIARGRLKPIATAMARGDTQSIDLISIISALPQEMVVTALFGLADVIIPKEHVFNMPPRVCVHVLRAGHMPHWDTPAQVERLLLLD